jgi:hypothetical protein
METLSNFYAHHYKFAVEMTVLRNPTKVHSLIRELSMSEEYTSFPPSFGLGNGMLSLHHGGAKHATAGIRRSLER